MSPADIQVAADDLRETVMARGGTLAIEITAKGTRVQLVDAFNLKDLAAELAADLKRLTS